MNECFEWSDLTSAKVVSPSALRREISEAGGIAIGIVGFSGRWDHRRADAESECGNGIRQMLGEQIAAKPEHPVWCISGATDSGVPKLAYEQSTILHCVRVGLTASAARNYRLAGLNFLTVAGEQFGDESETLIAVCDQLWVFGGGAQSRNEALLAVSANLPVTIVQGFGGVADEFTSETIEATFRQF